eukprot:2016094-Amphidinium_carterae.1
MHDLADPPSTYTCLTWDRLSGVHCHALSRWPIPTLTPSSYFHIQADGHNSIEVLPHVKKECCTETTVSLKGPAEMEKMAEPLAEECDKDKLAADFKAD